MTAYVTNKPSTGFIYYWDYEANQWVVTQNGVIMTHFNTAREAKEYCERENGEQRYQTIANDKHS